MLTLINNHNADYQYIYRNKMNKDRILNLFHLFSATLCHFNFWFSKIEITKLCNAMYVNYNGVKDANCSSFFPQTSAFHRLITFGG